MHNWCCTLTTGTSNFLNIVEIEIEKIIDSNFQQAIVYVLNPQNFQHNIQYTLNNMDC